MNDSTRSWCIDFEPGEAVVVISPAALALLCKEVTVSFWQYGSGRLPYEGSAFTATATPREPGDILHCHLGYRIGQQNYIAFQAGPSDGIETVVDDNEFKGQWNHWSFTKNVDAANIKIYLNGQLRYDSDISGFDWHGGDGSDIMNGPGATAFTIGGKPDANDSYLGLMSDFRLYNRQLNLNDINIIKDGGTLPPVAPIKASRPNPPDRADCVDVNTSLVWMPGVGTYSHDVYLGTNETEVTNACRLPGEIDGSGCVDFEDVFVLTQFWQSDPITSQPYADINGDDAVNLRDFAVLAAGWRNLADPAFKGNQNLNANTYNPTELQEDTTYYWRIDQLDGPVIVKGDIWHFTTCGSPP